MPKVKPCINFIFRFNSGKQRVKVLIYDVSQKRFERWGREGKKDGSNHGYYEPREGRNRYRGIFGILHLRLGSLDENLVAHEIRHLEADWCATRKMQVNEKNEEMICWLNGELNGNFWKEWRKHDSSR